jgi:hypothetical protein
MKASGSLVNRTEGGLDAGADWSAVWFLALETRLTLPLREIPRRLKAGLVQARYSTYALARSRCLA